MKYFNDCPCLKDIHYIIKENIEYTPSVKYHIENNLFLTESIYRYGSSEFFNLINEVRDLYNNNLIELSDVNKDIINSNIGEKCLYEGEEVYLDLPLPLLEAEYKGKDVELGKPKRGGSKKFYVYVKNDKGNVIKVSFGAKSGGQKLSVKLNDPKARAAFAKRHRCEEKNDKTKPSYWSCRLPRFSSSLGLSYSGSAKFW